jgi:hypothetical protein
VTAEQVVPLFSEAEILKAQKDLQFLSQDWTGEVPIRIHESGHDKHYGLGSSPPFSSEFVGYIGGLTCKNEHCSRCRLKRLAQPEDNEDGYETQRNNHRVRTTRAFRKLRRFAPLEYDVLWMAVMYHLTVKEITERLNDRAILKGYPERYSLADVAVLAVAGIDKVSRWY